MHVIKPYRLYRGRWGLERARSRVLLNSRSFYGAVNLAGNGPLGCARCVAVCDMNTLVLKIHASGVFVFFFLKSSMLTATPSGHDCFLLSRDYLAVPLMSKTIVLMRSVGGA